VYAPHFLQFSLIFAFIYSILLIHWTAAFARLYCFFTTVTVVFVICQLYMNSASEAKPDISPTKPDTYVIIDGVRKRLTDDVSTRRHQQESTPAVNQRNRTTAPVTYGEGIICLLCFLSVYLLVRLFLRDFHQDYSKFYVWNFVLFSENVVFEIDMISLSYRHQCATILLVTKVDIYNRLARRWTALG